MHRMLRKPYIYCVLDKPIPVPAAIRTMERAIMLTTAWIKETTRLTVVLLLILLAGCACQQHKGLIPVWPSAPAEPVIVFERSLYGSTSLNRSFWGGIKDFLFGESPDDSFAKPYGLVGDGDSKLFVVDTGRKSLVIMDFDAGTMKSIRSLDPT